MKLPLRILFFLLLGLTSASAQYAASPGDSGPKAAQPVPIDRRDWRDILTPQRCPNGRPAALNTCGDGRDGFGWQWDSFSGRLELRPPKILYGPGAVTSVNALTQNAWNNLYGAVGANGFRSGLTAYIPRGNYNGFGQVAVASGTASNPTYTVRVLMGTCLQATGAQQGILIVPQVPTSAGTIAGNNTLTFTSSACIQPGMVAYDVQHPSAIPAGITVSTTSPTTAVLSANVAAPGVTSGDTIMFGYVSGYGGPVTWPGGTAFAFTIPYFFTTAALQCLAADRSDQQCEMLTQIFTTDSGAAQLSASGQVTNPPYSTSFNIFRVDGGYGGL